MSVNTKKQKKFKELYNPNYKKSFCKRSFSRNVLCERVQVKYYFPGQVLFLNTLKGFQTVLQIKKCDLCSNQQLHHEEPETQRTNLLMDWFSVSPHRKHWSQCGARLILEIYMCPTGYIKDLLNEGPVASVQTVCLKLFKIVYQIYKQDVFNALKCLNKTEN